MERLINVSSSWFPSQIHAPISPTSTEQCMNDEQYLMLTSDLCDVGQQLQCPWQRIMMRVYSDGPALRTSRLSLYLCLCLYLSVSVCYSPSCLCLNSDFYLATKRCDVTQQHRSCFSVLLVACDVMSRAVVSSISCSQSLNPAASQPPISTITDQLTSTPHSTVTARASV